MRPPPPPDKLLEASSRRKRRSPLPTFAGDCNAPTTYFDETTTKRSGRPKHAKGSGTAHRQTVSFESGRTNQNFVRHQRAGVNCRGRDKKGFSDRGSYRCRYRKKLHRDYQCVDGGGFAFRSKSTDALPSQCRGRRFRRFPATLRFASQ